MRTQKSRAIEGEQGRCWDLLLSGYTENSIMHGRVNAGVLLPKPYLRSDLAGTIRTALAS